MTNDARSTNVKPFVEQRAPSDSVALTLTVIYPVFDTRGDAIDRIRLWTEEQEFEPHRYRVMVVAGPEADLDEARLRRSLRSHDIILRAPRVGREADYWNAGAREVTTPWILFVEAHGMPKSDSLSALAAWIDANPDGAACNFKIENLDRHLVAKLMKRWFAQIHDSWDDPATWRRLHRTAFAMRRDVFEDVGPFEPEYGQFAPPFLSARMHQRGIAISMVPTSSVVHDDAPEMSAHHDDTADYVRGEMNARMRSDPAFFEKYFGAAPLYGEDLMLPARHARSILKGVLVGALHWPGDAFRLVKRARRYFSAAFPGLRSRARLLAMLTRADEIAVMRLSRLEGLQWRRFLLAHRRVAQTERMLWLERHPLPPLQSTAGNGGLPVDKIGHHAFIGLFELEQFKGKALRWSQPVFLLRLAPIVSKGSVILETGNLRRLALSDILVVVGGRVLANESIAIDEMGNIRVQIVRFPTTQDEETGVVIIVREYRERFSNGRGGRRLGLPLLSVQFTMP